jgi:hypothetical protein
MTSAVSELLELLSQAQATPRFRADRVPRSILYDPAYRCVAIALSIEHGSDREHALNTDKLKLYQFVSIRPRVLFPLVAWVENQRTGGRVGLLDWVGFPRGYAQDNLHEKVMTYLLATGELEKTGSRVAIAHGSKYLTTLLTAISETGAFEREVNVLKALKGLRITKEMLR